MVVANFISRSVLAVLWIKLNFCWKQLFAAAGNDADESSESKNQNNKLKGAKMLLRAKEEKKSDHCLWVLGYDLPLSHFTLLFNPLII